MWNWGGSRPSVLWLGRRGGVIDTSGAIQGLSCLGDGGSHFFSSDSNRQALRQVQVGRLWV
jgi:hypothetical protein